MARIGTKTFIYDAVRRTRKEADLLKYHVQREERSPAQILLIAEAQYRNARTALEGAQVRYGRAAHEGRSPRRMIIGAEDLRVGDQTGTYTVDSHPTLVDDPSIIQVRVRFTNGEVRFLNLTKGTIVEVTR